MGRRWNLPIGGNQGLGLDLLATEKLRLDMHT